MTMKRNVFALFLTLVWMSADAVPIPAFDLTSYTSADAVFVGEIKGLQKIAEETRSYGSAAVPTDIMAAQVSISRMLKGDRGEKTITLRFLAPKVPLGYRLPQPGERGLMSANRRGEELWVANPYYPSLPADLAMVDKPATTPDLHESIIYELEAAAQADKLAPDERMRAVDFLIRIDGPIAVEALTRISLTPRGELPFRAAAGLILAGKVEPLPRVAMYLMSPKNPANGSLRSLLIRAVRDGVREPSAVPHLNALMKSQDVHLRRAAIKALRRAGGGAATEVLIASLSDLDVEVRYNALLGLATIAGDEAPTFDQFRENEAKYVSKWQGGELLGPPARKPF